MTYTTGKHNIKFGHNLKHNTNTFIAGNLSMGTFNFIGAYSGDGFADFLLGYPDNVQRSYFRSLWGNKANFQSLYVQDDFRLRSNLTLNVGIRYERNPLYEAVHGQTSALDFQTGKLVLPGDSRSPRSRRLQFCIRCSRTASSWRTSWACPIRLARPATRIGRRVSA